MRIWLIISLLLFSAARGAELRLVGIIDSANQRIFGISDNQTGQSAWLRLNDQFLGYKLDEFDSATGVLRLSESGSFIYLKLLRDPSLGVDEDLRRAHMLAERDAKLRMMLVRLYETRAALRAYEEGGRKGKPPAIFAGSGDQDPYAGEAWIKKEVLKRVKEIEDTNASK